MASRTFRQLIRFSVDACKKTFHALAWRKAHKPDGIERLLRLIQSMVHILVSFSIMLSIVTPHHAQNNLRSKSGSPVSPESQVLITALALKEQLGLTRRFFRTFRFLDAFNSAYTLASSRDIGSMPLVMALDIVARMFNGMYLLLEAVTLVDAMKIENLAVLTPEFEKILKIESQRSWFLALIAGGLSCTVAIYQAHTDRVTLEKLIKKESSLPESGEERKDEKPPRNQNEKAPLPRAVQMKQRIRDLEKMRLALSRKVTANFLDLALPGSVIGWVPASSGTVGLCMFVTSILTGWDVWERCGRETYE